MIKIRLNNIIYYLDRNMVLKKRYVLKTPLFCIYVSLDKHISSVGIFINLRKTFDTIGHSIIILDILEDTGIAHERFKVT